MILMQVQLVGNILIILGLAVLILFVSRRVRVFPVVGFILIGVLTGPTGLGLTGELHDVERLCEIGVVLLLFTIGLELSMERLWKLGRYVLIGGSFQVFVVLAVTYFLAVQFGQPPGRSVFLGFLASLSSATIVFKLLQEMRSSTQGDGAFAILIFQGFIAVPMVLLIPHLAEESSFKALLWPLVKGVALIVAAIIGTRWLVPHLLRPIAGMGSRELLHLALLAVGLVTAWLASSAGLSPALSAFLAGLILSGSELSRDALSKLLPLRDVFASFFFISAGMLVDPRVFVTHGGTIALLVLGIMALKTIICGVAATIPGYPLHVAILTGLALSQVGELSFVLSWAGADHGLLAGNSYQVFLAVSVLTMAVTPFVLNLAPRAGDLFMRLPVPRRLQDGLETRIDDDEVPMPVADLLIMGYGAAGRDVASSAEGASISYRIIDIDPNVVKSEKAKGRPIFQGDVTRRNVLEKNGIRHAKIIVITISDPLTVQKVVTLARSLSSEVYIIARTRSFSEMGPLSDLGANRVVSDQFEASLGTIGRVLRKFWNDPEKINRFVAEARADHYRMFRCVSKDAMSRFISYSGDLGLHSKEVWVLSLKRGSSLEGKSFGQVKLEERYGVELLGVCADSQIFTNLEADTLFFAGNIYVLTGESENLARVRGLFEA
jgi:CPA2 family monovalent cation:H+ antiporter-2